MNESNYGIQTDHARRYLEIMYNINNEMLAETLRLYTKYNMRQSRFGGVYLSYLRATIHVHHQINTYVYIYVE